MISFTVTREDAYLAAGDLRLPPPDRVTVEGRYYQPTKPQKHLEIEKVENGWIIPMAGGLRYFTGHLSRWQRQDWGIA